MPNCSQGWDSRPSTLEPFFQNLLVCLWLVLKNLHTLLQAYLFELDSHSSQEMLRPLGEPRGYYHRSQTPPRWRWKMLQVLGQLLYSCGPGRVFLDFDNDRIAADI